MNCSCASEIETPRARQLREKSKPFWSNGGRNPDVAADLRGQKIQSALTPHEKVAKFALVF